MRMADSALAVDELYVRPDDHWEANDVAKLCADVVDTLARVTADVSLQLKQNEPLAVKVLPATEDGDLSLHSALIHRPNVLAICHSETSPPRPLIPMQAALDGGGCAAYNPRPATAAKKRWQDSG